MSSLLKGSTSRLLSYIKLNWIKKSTYRNCSFLACRGYIEEALEQAKSNDIDFVPYRIRGYVLGNKFSNANVDIEQYLEDVDGCVRDPSSVTKMELENGNVFTSSLKFSALYHKAFESLERKYKNEENKLEFINDEILQFAIESFVREHHERCLRSVLETNEERKITVLLANHLFSRLVATTPGNTYFITNDHFKKFELCPCADQCGDKIWYGNSGIGSELLWYGKPDIMVFPLGGSCSIVLPKEKKKEMYIDEEKRLIEVKKESKLLRGHTNVSQFVSQTVTFSFYQKGFQLRKPESFPQIVTMIPTIAISDKCFDVYMYDTENDILLRNDGDPIPLWNNLDNPCDATLNMGAVLQLWMLINHLSVQPNLSPLELEKFSLTCGFASSLTHERLSRIEKEVTMRTKFLDHEIKEIKAPKSSFKRKLINSNNQHQSCQ
ncbi:unnamed protein product [Mytilus edulis]|uniref:Uncharacterized protein n=1 Tax=Mytilus edulis TaxID=6550 RepID=A0A8S3R6W1_MYTED|nr:unnamed protein product [Mytilus edulis]